MSSWLVQNCRCFLSRKPLKETTYHLKPPKYELIDCFLLFLSKNTHSSNLHPPKPPIRRRPRPSCHVPAALPWELKWRSDDVRAWAMLGIPKITGCGDVLEVFGFQFLGSQIDFEDFFQKYLEYLGVFIRVWFECVEYVLKLSCSFVALGVWESMCRLFNCKRSSDFYHPKTVLQTQTHWHSLTCIALLSHHWNVHQRKDACNLKDQWHSKWYYDKANHWWCFGTKKSLQKGSKCQTSKPNKTKKETRSVQNPFSCKSWNDWKKLPNSLASKKAADSLRTTVAAQHSLLLAARQRAALRQQRRWFRPVDWRVFGFVFFKEIILFLWCFY